jgi:cytidine deaminase
MASTSPSPKDHLKQLLKHAHCPISGFAVAATIRCSLAGKEYLFDGVNVEQSEQRLSTHAEEGAIVAAHTALGPDFVIEEMWVLARPRPDAPRVWPNRRPVACCGKCRQQIVAFATPETAVHAFSSGNVTVSTTAAAFLPAPFALPRSFNAPLAPPVDLIKHNPDDAVVESWLRLAARPGLISGDARAIALKLADDSVVVGAGLEDQAFLSISPAQAALAIAASLGKELKVKRYWPLDNKISDAEQQVLQPFICS